jgi:hypothetical protein
MRLLTVTVSALFIFCAHAQDGWKNPATIKATVSEWRETGKRETTLISYQNAYRVKTTQGVRGGLEGVPRVETISRAGVFTWIEDKPDVVMQLGMPTSWSVFEFLARPRFSRADLEIHLAGIEKALGRRVLAGRNESVNGRDCIVLTILDRPDSMNQDFQKVWIDRETGITMRQQDFARGQRVYEREITAISLSNDPPEEAMAHGPEAIVIRGPVSGDTLLRVPSPRPKTEFVEEINSYNERSKSDEKQWLRAPDIAGPFGYAQSWYRETIIPHVQLPGRRQGGGDSSFEERGNFLVSDFKQEIASIGQGGDFTFAVALDGSGMRQAKIEARIDGERREFVVTQSEGGQISIQGPASGGRAAGSTEPGDIKLFIAKSDFVDPKTGHTLTLIQTQGVPPVNFLDGAILGTPKQINDPRLPEGSIYHVQFPYKMTVVTWQKGKVRYGLASTSATESELLTIASKIQ